MMIKIVEATLYTASWLCKVQIGVCFPDWKNVSRGGGDGKRGVPLCQLSLGPPLLYLVCMFVKCAWGFQSSQGITVTISAP